MSYIQAKNEIEHGAVQGVYFMYGTQVYLMEDLVQSIIKQTAESADDANVITYSLEDTPLHIAVEEIETIPFFGGKKIVVIKNFSLVTSQKQEGKVEHDLSRLENYVEHQSSEAVLILLCPFEKLDERKKITKFLKKNATVIDCSPLDEEMTGKWLDARALEKGFTLTKDGKERLLERVGPKLLMLASELEKLALYVGKDGIANSEIVDLLVVRSLEQDVFALIDFAVKGKLDQALIIYHDLLKKKEEPLKLLALLARQLRIYYQVKELSRRSYSQKQIASHLKLHPYVVKLASQQVGRFDEKKLLLLLEQAADTDYAIKTGKMEKELAVELLLMRLSTLRQ
ncbi:DNA polymerase III subunit delta [bacterium LRH843]|nr:DNA polymerase III subunit delta [bacterium LRH843]